MPATTFVGREQELRQLQQFLDQATTSRTQVAFISGDAGAGKSALVAEFMRRAQAADSTVVAVLGECNAQTGIGDPYLPLRQVLTALTTDKDEGKPTAGPKNLGPLKEFVRVASETLITVGPDLIGIFVPGAALVGKIATTAATKGKLADRLAERIGKTDKPAAAPSMLNTTLDQAMIFEQYTAVLKALAQERTLVLVLDDLQWADAGSLNLLFHLARELKDSRVLLLGTYRSDDVALGRGGERHPLEPILNELMRYNGNIVIDLAQTREEEGRAFVDALIDAQPNGLDKAFRQQVFARTDGQALFTVELLRYLEERGALVKDAEGRLCAGPALNWDELPARIEGVIGERLARLTTDLRETLTIASVMGVDFVAQVIAMVQKTNERDLIRMLSRELDKRYRLVNEEGETRIGKQFLTRYRFTHALFQYYLYNDLSAAERRLMQGDVADALESLYTGNTDEIAVQLAWHYADAGDDTKASEYEIRAADASARMLAFPAAREHYQRALALLAKQGEGAEVSRVRIDTTIKYVSVAMTTEAPAQLLARLQDAEALANALPSPMDMADRSRLAHLNLRLGYVYFMLNDTAMASHYLQPLLQEAKTLGDMGFYADAARQLGL
jgi:predicted ATPase